MHLLKFVFLVAVFCISPIVGENPEFVENENGFSIFYKGVELLRHTSGIPMLAAGHGEFLADDNLGNWNLSITEENRLELDLFDVLSVDEEIRLNLTSHATKALNIMVVIKESYDKRMELNIDYTESTIPSPYINQWHLRLPAEEDEYIWGGGEQFTYLNLREGGNYPLWVREQGVGRNKSDILTQLIEAAIGGGGDYHTTYWPQPSFLSSRGYHFDLEFPAYSELRLVQKDSSFWRSGHEVYWHYTPVEAHPCVNCRITFSVENSLMEIVQSINPGQPELPEWVYNGAILGVQGGTTRMLEILEQARENDVQVSGLWIQDWSGKIVTEFGTRVFWNWRWNETWYPNLDTVIADLKEEGVRVTAYITPHLNVDGDVFKEHEEDNYWITDSDDNDNTLTQDFGEFTVATVDIMKQDPECNCLNPSRIWYQELIQKNLIDLGFSGWMADFGEYTPMSAKTQFIGRWWGEDYGEILHQTISQNWASLNREAVEAAGKLGDILFWMRSGGFDSKNTQVMSWAGDQTVDWSYSDGLPSSIVAALSLAVSGMGLSHSDIGGYTAVPQIPVLGPVRSKELLLRWAEYAAFTPVMRTHEGNRPVENYQVYDDDETFKQFGRLTKIYKELAEYTKATVKQNTMEGKPVMRPLFLAFEADKDCYDYDYQYMYGDDLLVAPVLEPEVTTWMVYLPASEQWILFWDLDQTIIDGGQTVEVKAPLGKPPVFYRANSSYKELFHTTAQSVM